MEKENLPKWEDITREELCKLYFNNSQSMIADMFGIDVKFVKGKLSKFNINKFTADKYNPKLDLNTRAWQDLIDFGNINTFSKAIAKYIFRETSIEDLHVEFDIPQNRMKEMNKEVVDKVSNLLYLFMTCQYHCLSRFLHAYGDSLEWDDPKIDLKYIEWILNMYNDELGYELKEDMNGNSKNI